jgi:hypothetical protein
MPRETHPGSPYFSEGRRVLLWLVGAAAVGALVLIGTAYGYLRLFSQVAAYDDEGYVMQSVRSFLDGHALYNEVYSQYGPAYYLLQRIVYGLFRVPLTHDVVRLTTLAMWIATAAASAGIVVRLTRSLVLAAIVFIHVVIHLLPAINEPGHPQTLLGLIVAVACLVCASARGDIAPRVAVFAGILAGFAAFVKVNVGVYLFLGLAVPLVLASPFGRVAGPVLLLVGTALPILLMRQHVGNRSANYALVGAFSAAAVTYVSWRLLRPSTITRQTLTAFVAAAAATGAAIVLAILALGTTPSALVHGILLHPARLTTLFYMPVAITSTAGPVAGAALLLAVLVSLRRVRESPAWPAIAFVCKAGFGIGTLYVAQVGYVELMQYATPFVWIVILPVRQAQGRRPADGEPTGAVPRAILAAVAAFELLQAYPVGGTQVPFATFPIMAPALVSLYDAMAILAARTPVPRVAMVLLQVFALLWARSAFTPIVGREVLHHYYAVYMGNESVRLPGTMRIRLTPAEVARMQWLTGTLRANCSSFVALPGFPSLHPWTGIAPLTTKNAGTWMTLLSPEEQQQLWAAVDARKTPCAILNQEVASNWIGFRPSDGLPAYRELAARFDTVATVDGYELMLRRDRDPSGPPLMMSLVNGRQTFGGTTSPLHVLPQFVDIQPESTIRTWIRTTKRGVILSCRAEASPDRGAAHPLPLLYVSRSGKLYGQLDSGTREVAPTQQAVNDGRWHHVALVRRGSEQSLFVDGLLQHSTKVTSGSLTDCQVGTGVTTDWPEGTMGLMAYTGEIEGLVGQARAWSADDVVRDMRETAPKD